MSQGERQHSCRRACRKACSKCGRATQTQYTYLYQLSRFGGRTKLASSKQWYCRYCDGVPTPPNLKIGDNDE